jgi:hypothetical protein
MDGGVRGVDMLLQRFEVGQTRRQHEGHFAVEQRAVGRQALERLGDGGEAYRPVEAASAEQGDGVADFPREDAVAVIFDFVQPVPSLRNLAVERGKLRRDEGELYRAGFRTGFSVTARLLRV